MVTGNSLWSAGGCHRGLCRNSGLALAPAPGFPESPRELYPQGHKTLTLSPGEEFRLPVYDLTVSTRPGIEARRPMVTWQEHIRQPERRGGSRVPPAAMQQILEARESPYGIDDQLDQTEAVVAPCQATDMHGTVERRLADQFVVQAICAEGLHGARHQALEGMLISYAVPVLRKLLADGRIIIRARKLGRSQGSVQARLDLTDADREELLRDMIADALPVFNRAVFGDQRWDPWRGASLKTYFVNACILQFPQLNRQRLDQRAARPVSLDIDTGLAGPAPDPATMVALRDEVHRVLAEITDRQLREVLILRAAGYTAEDAARQAGLTPKAAEGRLARLRQRLNGARAATDPLQGSRRDTEPEGQRAQ